jgi:hypothetical protein
MKKRKTRTGMKVERRKGDWGGDEVSRICHIRSSVCLILESDLTFVTHIRVPIVFVLLIKQRFSTSDTLNVFTVQFRPFISLNIRHISKNYNLNNREHLRVTVMPVCTRTPDLEKHDATLLITTPRCLPVLGKNTINCAVQPLIIILSDTV